MRESSGRLIRYTSVQVTIGKHKELDVAGIDDRHNACCRLLSIRMGAA